MVNFAENNSNWSLNLGINQSLDNGIGNSEVGNNYVQIRNNYVQILNSINVHKITLQDNARLNIFPNQGQPIYGLHVIDNHENESFLDIECPTTITSVKLTGTQEYVINIEQIDY